jgi:hypothetical protein
MKKKGQKNNFTPKKILRFTNIFNKKFKNFREKGGILIKTVGDGLMSDS